MILFDTLDAERKLMRSGFDKEKADEIIEVIKDSQTDLVTKSDLKLVYIAIVCSPFLPEIFKLIK